MLNPFQRNLRSPVDALPQLSTASGNRRQSRVLHCEGHERQALAYVYFEEESGRRTAASLLTRHEARRVAINIATLPDLLKRPQ